MSKSTNKSSKVTIVANGLSAAHERLLEIAAGIGGSLSSQLTTVARNLGKANASMVADMKPADRRKVAQSISMDARGDDIKAAFDAAGVAFARTYPRAIGYAAIALAVNPDADGALRSSIPADRFDERIDLEAQGMRLCGFRPSVTKSTRKPRQPGSTPAGEPKGEASTEGGGVKKALRVRTMDSLIAKLELVAGDVEAGATPERIAALVDAAHAVTLEWTRYNAETRK